MADEAAILQATAAEVAKDGSTYVVLRWEAVDDVVGYNLYRSVDGEPPRESRPINGSTPITPPTSGKRLRELVAEDSPEWRALTRAHDAGAASSPGASGLANPAALERGLTPESLRLVRAVAQANLAMGHAAGLAYTDRAVKAEEHYLYELRGVRKDRTEFQLAVDVPVWAGHFILPDPPSGLGTQAGDRRALVLWNRNPYAATYIVQRSTSPGGPFQRVNPKPVAYDLEADIDGQPLPAPQPGFLDIGAWDANGLPTSHLVEGASVYGPDNGVTYWYQVASRDTLDRAGAVVSGGRGNPRAFDPADGSRRAAGVADDDRGRSGRHLAQGDPQRREPPAARRHPDQLRLPRRYPRGARGRHGTGPATSSRRSRPTRSTSQRRW